MQERESLSDGELRELVQRVFRPTGRDTRIAVLTDLPATPADDETVWRERRELAWEWARRLHGISTDTGLEADLYTYPSVGQNNADLPATAWQHHRGPMPLSCADLAQARAAPFAQIFDEHSIVIAPTQFSTTAPLKLAAAKHDFRAATMPGFSAEMIPALKLDYREVDRLVQRLKILLDRATAAYFRFETDAGTEMLQLDLRHRNGHASSGVVTLPGTAGNLPSGEAYIVPYEGERPGDPSRSAGRLPVQLEDEVVVFRIEGNRAVAVESDGAISSQQADYLAREPAYGNLAELGLGVLNVFDIRPIGRILLDEKLGLHIAFGRSDHFGGQVGPAQFTSPSATVHIDRVYLSETQPQVQVRSVVLEMPGGETLPLMRDQRYAI